MDSLKWGVSVDMREIISKLTYLNNTILKLEHRYQTIDGVRKNQIKPVKSSGGYKGDVMGSVVANKEEILLKIKELSVERGKLADIVADVINDLMVNTTNGGSRGFKSLWTAYSVLVLNISVEDVAISKKEPLVYVRANFNNAKKKDYKV